jgi:hypothetical protein
MRGLPETVDGSLRGPDGPPTAVRVYDVEAPIG